MLSVEDLNKQTTVSYTPYPPGAAEGDLPDGEEPGVKPPVVTMANYLAQLLLYQKREHE